MLTWYDVVVSTHPNAPELHAEQTCQPPAVERNSLWQVDNPHSNTIFCHALVSSDDQVVANLDIPQLGSSSPSCEEKGADRHLWGKDMWNCETKSCSIAKHCGYSTCRSPRSVTGFLEGDCWVAIWFTTNLTRIVHNSTRDLHPLAARQASSWAQRGKWTARLVWRCDSVSRTSANRQPAARFRMQTMARTTRLGYQWGKKNVGTAHRYGAAEGAHKVEQHRSHLRWSESMRTLLLNIGWNHVEQHTSTGNRCRRQLFHYSSWVAGICQSNISFYISCVRLKLFHQKKQSEWEPNNQHLTSTTPRKSSLSRQVKPKHLSIPHLQVRTSSDRDCGNDGRDGRDVLRTSCARLTMTSCVRPTWIHWIHLPRTCASPWMPGAIKK